MGQNQVHDYNPGIASNGVFWTIPIPTDSVKVDLDNATASMKLSMVSIPDDHDLQSSITRTFPPGFPQSAVVDFDVEWSSVINHGRQNIRSETQRFFGQFIETSATIRWSAHQAGFEFVSEEPNPERNRFSVLGHELNGVFFPDGD